MNMIATDVLSRDPHFMGSTAHPKQGVIVIVSDNAATTENLAPVCEFLDLRMEVVSAGMDLANVLLEHRPLAVISDVDCEDHDGFHVMKLIAQHDREIPILLLTNGDSALMGAADAVQVLCGLTTVTVTSGFPMAGQLVAFLFNAGRRAGCMRLIPV
jgi:CheY-like chemotaxis protein